MVEEKKNIWGRIPRGEIGLMDELVSIVTLKRLTLKLFLHFAHLLISLPVKLISILCQMSLTPYVKYKISSSSLPTRLMAAN